MKKLSIIIPVYNVEKYVAKCIRSCLNQNIGKDKYEIIIINDGTTDNSLEIVNNIVKNQDNIIVFSQKNSGLSLARNKGLDLAKGEYVWFIDSDDWIKDNCLSSIINKLDYIEILAMGYIEAYDDSKKNKSIFVSNDRYSRGVDLLKDKFIMPAQFYIYKKSFLIENNLFFQPRLLHEDFEFTPRMLYLANNLLVFNELVYFFYKRPGSITTSVNPQKSFDLIKIALRLISFEQSFVENKNKYIFHNLAFLALNNALYNSLIMDRNIKNKFRIELYKEKWMFKYLKSSTIFKYRIERIIFFIFPKHTTFLYKLLKLISR